MLDSFFGEGGAVNSPKSFKLLFKDVTFNYCSYLKFISVIFYLTNHCFLFLDAAVSKEKVKPAPSSKGISVVEQI